MIDAQAPLLYTPLRQRVFSKLQPETASSEAITVPMTSGYFFVSQYQQQLKLGDRAEFAKSVSESDIDLYAGSTYLVPERKVPKCHCEECNDVAISLIIQQFQYHEITSLSLC